MEFHEGIVVKQSSSEYDVVAVILTLSASFVAHLRWAGGGEGMRYRGRRNKRLIAHESKERGIALWRDGLWFQLGRDFINLFEWMLREENSFE
jgi:hypothetical protein